MPSTIFYSWQSDLPNKTNRKFIEECLREAIAEVTTDATLLAALRDNEISLDKDTLNVSGSPPIVEVIFQKIADCVAFIPDLTFVAKTEKGRPIPNPNVLVEYGWALKTVSNLRIVPVMNGYYGKPTWETLPFDMRHLRHPFVYELSPECSPDEKKAARTILVSHLKIAIRTVFESGLVAQRSDPITDVKECLRDDKGDIRLSDLVHAEQRRALRRIQDDELVRMSPTQQGWSDNELRERASRVEAETGLLRRMLTVGCYWGRGEHANLWVGTIRAFDNFRTVQSGLTHLIEFQSYSSYLLFQAGAFSAFAGERYDTLAKLLGAPEFERLGEDVSATEAFLSHDAYSLMDRLQPPPPEGKVWTFPSGSMNLEEVLRHPADELLPLSGRFEDIFDRFEYVSRLLLADSYMQRNRGASAPGGAFEKRYNWRTDRGVFSFYDREVREKGADLPFLKAGLFGASVDRFLNTRAQCDPYFRRRM